MGYTRDSFLIKRLIPFQGCLSSREAEGLSVMSTSSILFNGHYESNVYIFISSLGPSDAYSSTLSSLNFNLWPHLTDQMVFPKINHGFLSADQQLIKRRLIKVVLLPAGVWFLLCVQLLLWVLLLCIYLSCMAHRWWVGLCKYPRIRSCLVTYSIESLPGLFCFLIKTTSVVTSNRNRHIVPEPSGSDKLYICYAIEQEPIMLNLWFCE